MSDSRKIKLKTLDNNLTELVVNSEVLILNLKKMIKDKMNMPVEGQRLIYKGRQLKDDKKLNEYINSDDEVIHLMSRAIENNESSTNTTNESNQQQPRIDLGNLGNMFGNILNNPNTMIQISGMVLDDLNRNPGGQSNQANPFANILQNLTNSQARVNSFTNQPNNQPIIQSTVNNTQNTTQSTNPQTTHNMNTINTLQDINHQYPILRPANQHMSNLSNIVNEITGGNSNYIPEIPGHTYPRNILMALALVLKNYHNNVSRFLPFISILVEGLEKESLINNPDQRRKVQELAGLVTKGLNEIGQCCSVLQQSLNGLNIGNSPGTGFTTLVQGSIEAISVISPSSNFNQQNQNTTQEREVHESNNTNQSSTINNPMGQILNQLNQPGGLQNMMNMVGSMLGNSNSGGNNDMMNMFNSILGGGSNNQFSNLINNLMNQDGAQQPEEEPLNNRESLLKLISCRNSRQNTLLKDISNLLNIRSEEDFNYLYSFVQNLTLQEINEIYSTFNLSCINRIRKMITISLKQTKVDDNTLKNRILSILLERIIVVEDENDKMTNLDFNIENYLVQFVENLIKILLSEVNDNQFENELKRIFLNFIGDIFEDLSKSYNSGKRGALKFLFSNLNYLLSSLIGTEAVDILNSINEGFIEKFIDLLIESYYLEKNNCDKMDIDANDLNIDTDRILEISKLDNNREVVETEFSETYKKTSLYK